MAEIEEPPVEDEIDLVDEGIVEVLSGAVVAEPDGEVTATEAQQDADAGWVPTLPDDSVEAVEGEVVADDA